MNIKKTIAKSSIILVLGLSGLVVMANSLSYKQTSCKYRPDHRYVWIKLDNGVQKKGIAFVSDGVIFESSIIGMTYTKGYPDTKKIVYGKGKEGLGHLAVEYTEDGQLGREDVGYINERCWKNLKTLIAANPDSRHIKMFDEGSSSRHSIN